MGPRLLVRPPPSPPDASRRRCLRVPASPCAASILASLGACAHLLARWVSMASGRPLIGTLTFLALQKMQNTSLDVLV